MYYYLYRHTRLDTNEVFYIGIGHTEKLGIYKRSKRKDNRSDFWKNITNQTEYKIDIIFISEDKQFICRKEIRLIKLYGRRDLGLGTLVNHTDGGEFGYNRIVSENTRLKLKQKWLENDYREKSMKTWFKPDIPSQISKLVLNIETGIYYDSIAEAAESIDVKVRSLNWSINKAKIKKSKFIKV